MRVEQQNAGIIDVLQQNIGPEANKGISGNEIAAWDSAVVKSGQKDSTKSVNMKDATYLKPGTEEKKTITEEIEQSEAVDATERKNQMAVLANTTSAEDYAKMQEEGFTLDETTSNTIITETDKIKAQLAKAGVDISFFGDDLDLAQLEAITGSAELAAQLASVFKEADLPCTGENIREVMEALELAGMLQNPGDGAIKYMLDNEMEPTIENLYKAEYSGSSNYQVNRGQTIDMSLFMDRVEKIIRQSGLAVDEQTKEASQWMLENDVPLNEENLKYLMALKGLKMPLDSGTVTESIVAAISEGKRPQKAVLLEDYSLEAQAQDALSVVAGATDEDLAYVIDNGMEVTVRSLKYAMANRTQSGTAAGAAGTTEHPEGAGETEQETSAALTETAASGEYTKEGLALLTARRQLEEIRLAMTAQANYALLKQGIQIDTEPLAKLVEDLKANEDAYYANLLKSQGIEATEENISLFRETAKKVSDLKTVPAYVLGIKEAAATVNEVHEAGKVLQDTFERANERYETLMTAPRPDLGDSIQKAFRNVDDILRELGLENSEANQRAVRILGYNQLEITAESVAQMKAADEEVQRAFHNLTPATVIQMIKREINPLDMDFASLNEAAEQIQKEIGTQENRKFGEFLWKLEKTGSISEEERASYVGVYRLIHQVEKTDGAVIGALLNQGAEITMRNLMMAVRSEHRSGKMEFAVDDSFGERKDGGNQGTSITDQVETSYQSNCLKDIVETLTPAKLQKVMGQAADWENMSPEQLKEALAQVKTDDEDLDYAYAKEQLAELEQSAKVAQNIYDVLQKYDIPNTMSNVMAMESMIKNRNGMFRKIFGGGVKDAGEEIGTDDLEEIKQELLEEFGEAVSAPAEMAEAQEKLGELAENVMKTMIESDEVTSLDVREMRLLSAQLSIDRLLAREERYSVPVLVSDGIVNVSLKIVRGVDKKGIVDIAMESELRGKIAATFQAKEQGIKGLVTADNQETKELLEENGTWLKERFEEEENIDLHYAHISDLDLDQFSMGMSGVDANAQTKADKSTGEYQVQTARLYHIAETFIRQIREVL